MIHAFYRRFVAWLLLMGTSFSQFVFNSLCAGLWWVITGRGTQPDPDDPLSARIGRNAADGKLWALLLEVIVDDIFGEGHCRASRR